MLCRIEKLEGEKEDQVHGCFRDKMHRVGWEALERSKMIPEFPRLGNWVEVMLFIKIGRQEEEQVWVGKVMSSFLGQPEFEVPQGKGGGDPQ